MLQTVTRSRVLSVLWGRRPECRFLPPPPTSVPTPGGWTGEPRNGGVTSGPSRVGHIRHTSRLTCLRGLLHSGGVFVEKFLRLFHPSRDSPRPWAMCESFVTSLSSRDHTHDTPIQCIRTLTRPVVPRISVSNSPGAGDMSNPLTPGWSQSQCVFQLVFRFGSRVQRRRGLDSGRLVMGIDKGVISKMKTIHGWYTNQ